MPVDTDYDFGLTILQQNIIRSLEFLFKVIDRRLQQHFGKVERFTLPEFALEPDNAPLNRFIDEHEMNIEEYLILLLGLVPHVQPAVMDSIVQKYLPEGGEFPEFGGVKMNNYRGMLPTGETAQFVLSGSDVANRLRVSRYFSTEHFFYRQNILSLEAVREGEPSMSGRIILSQEYVELFTIGKVSPPAFSGDFPAKRIETQMVWEDLVLHQNTREQVDDIKKWLEHNASLEMDPVMSKKIKKGYRVLFYGPPGTGKTLTATLLGNQFGKDVYRIDLSQVVSKYIGETEKNLEKIFLKAEHKNWILFFDEADALFGKRSNVSSAHDKYANQEVSYLLQRVEDFPGLIILASNFKNNIDQAFVRRFNAVVHFPLPNGEERLAIWQKNLPSTIPVEDEKQLKFFADKYELSGSAISNIMHYAALCALSNGRIITGTEIERGIRREMLKEDKLFH